MLEAPKLSFGKEGHAERVDLLSEEIQQDFGSTRANKIPWFDGARVRTFFKDSSNPDSKSSEYISSRAGVVTLSCLMEIKCCA